LENNKVQWAGPRTPTFRALGRGLSKRCPKCGESSIFKGYFEVRVACPTCDFPFQRAIDDHVAIIYFSTAIQTAIFAAFVLVFKPENPWLARGILAVVAVSVMLLNLPNRKGFAIALDYVTGRGIDPNDPSHQDG
jgi:uncharacterized protein (DUF983 family)